MTYDQENSLPKVLIVEDDPEIREQVKWALSSLYAVLEAEDRSTAVALMERECPHLVTLDLGLPPQPDNASEGFATLEKLLAINPIAKVVVATGNSDLANALQAVERGAYDFLHKPVHLDELKVILQRATYLSNLEQKARVLREEEGEREFHGILGESAQIQRLFQSIRKVAVSEIPVLIQGESGTGKELIAKAIHEEGGRKKGPFVAINCGAIPETLLESELFGHEKGSFTGAHVQRKGRIETAQGGTLFLDEIGELSPPLQVKLLRFLQESTIERVGGREPIKVDTRVVAATNVDLEKALQEGRFREDLYYRLSVVILTAPPLRERPGDAILLARVFLSRDPEARKKKITGFTQKALRLLELHDWPGNVRELENRIKRAVIMADGRRLTPKDFDLTSELAKSDSLTLREARRCMEKDLIRQILAKHDGNISRAAIELGVSRPTLHDLVGKYSIEPKALSKNSPPL